MMIFFFLIFFNNLKIIFFLFLKIWRRFKFKFKKNDYFKKKKPIFVLFNIKFVEGYELYIIRSLNIILCKYFKKNIINNCLMNYYS